MKRIFLLLFCAAALVASCSKSAPVRDEILMDFGWNFTRGDISGAEAADFDDSAWRTLDLPHDWSTEDMPGTESPFDPDAISSVDGGFTTGGTAWYRKKFTLPESAKNKTVELLFEGIYMNSDVWLNGHHLGNNIYGYTPFGFDVTEFMNQEGENVLAVQVKNEGRNSRWYSGSGIYRHVWLKILDPVHIVENGVFITTPEVSASNAAIEIKTTVENKTGTREQVILTTEIFGPNKQVVAREESKESIDAGTAFEFTQNILIDRPKLWSPDSPSLYSAKTTVRHNSVKDVKSTTFGIRTITMDAKNGFVLNGEPMLLKGGCVHHDNGPLGSRAFDRAEERRVELLKASGYNAVRCAHNPPSMAFLDACDRLGLLVIDEAVDMWLYGKNPDDYGKYFDKDWQTIFRAMVERDRNHPSVFMWSLGNEIPGMASQAITNTSLMLGDFVRSLDPTRPVTAGVNGLDGNRDEFLATLDVWGFNYAIWPGHDYFKSYIEKFPDAVIYCSESYPLDEFDAWEAVEKYPSVIGDFVWTAFDYIGEASIGWQGYPHSKEFYPWNLASCGDIDICGWKRPQSYYRDAFWSDEPNVAIAVHPPVPSFEPQQTQADWSRWYYEDVVFDWNWEEFEGKPIEVDVYTSCDEVEIFLNGESLGRRTAGREAKNKVTYEVPYATGELKAVGYKGDATAETILETSAPASVIKMTADRSSIKADGQDLCYVTIELCDMNGVLDPKADAQLEFELTGEGSIVAVGNANPKSLESYTLPKRQAWRGKCLVIVKSDMKTGNMTLRASASGFETASVRINAIRH